MRVRAAAHVGVGGGGGAASPSCVSEEFVWCAVVCHPARSCVTLLFNVAALVYRVVL